MIFTNNQVQNELEAYLLGLFYADGYITGFSYNKWRNFGIALKENADNIPLPQLKKHNYKNLQLRNGHYTVKIYYNRKGEYLGTYSTIKEAIEAYNKRAKELNITLQEYKGEYYE